MVDRCRVIGLRVFHWFITYPSQTYCRHLQRWAWFMLSFFSHTTYTRKGVGSLFFLFAIVILLHLSCVLLYLTDGLLPRH